MAVVTTIQLRRGTASQWTSANPILAAGEFGLETDTNEFKLGNGTDAWTTLPYWISMVAGHTHTAAQISDSTATGRALITALDAAAARTAIGAGTSNLAIGTSGTTAMVGNKTFAYSELTGTIPTAALPPLAIAETSVVATQAAMLALTAQRGDVAIRTDTGRTFILATDDPTVLANWKEITAAGAVISVASKTGVVTLVKADVGLANVDDTSDAAKPISTATQTALNLKAALASPTFTGTPTLPAGTLGLTKTTVGLANVDNTTDAAKPVSTATQTALNLKANLASPTFTGTVTLPSTTNGLTKTNVGLANVDNTTDAAKPISTATQTALNGKANTSHTHTSADITAIDGGTP